MTFWCLKSEGPWSKEFLKVRERSFLVQNEFNGCIGSVAESSCEKMKFEYTKNVESCIQMLGVCHRKLEVCQVIYTVLQSTVVCVMAK